MENEHLNARMLTQAQADFLDHVSAWLRRRWDQENIIGFMWNGRNAANEIDEMTAKSRDWHLHISEGHI